MISDYMSPASVADKQVAWVAGETGQDSWK